MPGPGQYPASRVNPAAEGSPSFSFGRRDGVSAETLKESRLGKVGRLDGKRSDDAKRCAVTLIVAFRSLGRTALHVRICTCLCGAAATHAVQRDSATQSCMRMEVQFEA